MTGSGFHAGLWEDDERASAPDSLEEQYARARRAGSAAASGGCTDAGVRLGGLLSVRPAHPPAQSRWLHDVHRALYYIM